MNPVNRFVPAAFRDAGRHDDTESTESCSEEEVAANRQFEQTVSELARALMAWSPELIGPDVPACASHPAAGAPVEFLTELDVQTRPRLALRREVMAWLKGLGGNAQRQQQVLDGIGDNSGAVPAMALYQMLRDMN
ncbi:hypothetical protein ABC383_01035 [Noviherbaspirillum sp. 1P10PC]|uniref:hypothetical protein n=1 Tax=Noviherbaspirillum sp. 1P10PC TaxID=3132292 RepID=UPI0039A3412D